MSCNAMVRDAMDRDARHGGVRARRQRGLSLLECAASVALAGLVLSSSAQASLSAATIVKGARALAATTDVARNLLEQELGAPCGAAPACPAGYRCHVTRSALTGAADRLVVRVERSDGAAIEELRTLAAPPSCSG